MVHPRDVFRDAIISNASAIILAHNHPSGDPTPSKPDRELTRALTDAGEALHIPIIDHIIIGSISDNTPVPYFSFREHGLINA